MDNIKTFARMLRKSDNIVFFGGAGVSTESGVKDYRSEDGLYNTVKDHGVSPEEILSIGFFRKKPDVFYHFYKNYFITDALPNPAHKALAELERMGKLRAVITQNIDNLHQAAGSCNVVELHGNTREFFCDSCGKYEKTETAISEILDDKVPKCTHCGGLLRPKVVLYGEMLHENVPETAISHIENADLLIVGGTSLAVYPAATFVRYYQGKNLVIINKSETSYDVKADLVIREPIGEVFEKAMKELK